MFFQSNREKNPFQFTFSHSSSIQALILVNNKITIIHAKALSPLTKLQRLYLSKNLLKDVPANMPKSLQELRIHENEITKIKKASFQAMSQMIVMGMRQFSLVQNGHAVLLTTSTLEIKTAQSQTWLCGSYDLVFCVFGFGLVLIIFGTFGPILWNDGSCGQQGDLVQLQYNEPGPGNVGQLWCAVLFLLTC